MQDVGASVVQADASGDPSHDRNGLIERVLASSADCIKVLDLDGKLTYINAAGCRLMEVDDAAPVLTKLWTGFWESEHRERADEALKAALSGEG